MADNNFLDFPGRSKKDWIDQAKKDLKGADFEKKLVTQTIEGFSTFPFYTAEDTEGLQWIKSFHNQFDSHLAPSQNSPRKWSNVVEISPGGEKEQNEEMLHVLQSGAEGCIITLSGQEDFSILFGEISLGSSEIWLRHLGSPEACLNAFFNWVEKNPVPAQKIRGGLIWDSLAVGFDQPIRLEDQMDRLLNVFERCRPYRYFKSICLNTSIYHNAGGTAVQEIGYGLGALIEIMDGLTERGCDKEELFRDLFVLTAVGSNYFMEIAKLKAFRVVATQLSLLYGLALAPGDFYLFAKSSYWSKCKTDPYNNLLRNTSEAMSAIIGGCNALFVEPHDQYSQSGPQGFSKRMARNISSILKEECYFDKVIDPAAGSYYLENLVDLLSDHVMQFLHQLEDEGGWGNAYSDNRIQKAVKETRKTQFERLIAGQKQLVGIQPNPQLDMDIEAIIKSDSREEPYQLKPFSQDFPFETKT